MELLKPLISTLTASAHEQLSSSLDSLSVDERGVDTSGLRATGRRVVLRWVACLARTEPESSLGLTSQ